jgi:hypothetical protein
MNQIPDDLAKRLLYILHRGLIEIRNLALAQGQEQIADLADALEILPGFFERWQDSHLEMIRFVLRTYQGKYPGGAYDYLANLDRYPPPDHF